MRGTIIALTDDTGNIAETYSYDPFGNILSTPTIYNPKLFISRDDVLYDPEISLYYIHARYYDPEAGRFIMKDPVEGSLSNPITHGFRIKCGMTKRRSANDSVNKIDPAGTVTREAFERNHPDPPPKPPQCFSSQCIGWGGTLNGLPGLECPKGDPFNINKNDLPSCKLEGEDLSKYFYDPNGSDPTIASTVLGGGLGDFAATCSIPADGGGSPSETVELPDEDFNIKIVVNDDGSYEVYAVDKKTGEKVENKKTEDLIGRIKDGINKAINELKSQNVQFDLVKALKDMAKFAATYYKDFDIRMTGGKNTWTGHFFYHAMRGAVIAQYLADEPLPLKGKEDKEHPYPDPADRDPDDDFNQYNVAIGFWCSFYDQAMGFNMKFFGINDQYPGLVEFGNLIKSVIMQESSFSQWEDPNVPPEKRRPKGHDPVGGEYTRWGLMAVGFYGDSSVGASVNPIFRRMFPGASGISLNDIKYEPFWNIGAGVGHLCFSMNYSSNPFNKTPSKGDWERALLRYNPSNIYVQQIVTRWWLYNKESYKKRPPSGAE